MCVARLINQLVCHSPKPLLVLTFIKTVPSPVRDISLISHFVHEKPVFRYQLPGSSFLYNVHIAKHVHGDGLIFSFFEESRCPGSLQPRICFTGFYSYLHPEALRTTDYHRFVMLPDLHVINQLPAAVFCTFHRITSLFPGQELATWHITLASH